MPARRAEIQAAYNNYLQTVDPNLCAFCELLSTNTQQVIAEHPNFLIAENRFPYNEWDAQLVTEHIMIIPKRHLMKFSEFTPGEASQFLEIITEFEDEGYSIYARAQQNKSRTITHQHTHLLRLTK